MILVLKVLAVVVGFAIGRMLYPSYQRWRIRRMWRRKARSVAWLLPPEDRQ